MAQLNAATMEQLLDFEKPLDVALLDATVNAFYTSTNQNEVSFRFFHEPIILLITPLGHLGPGLPSLPLGSPSSLSTGAFLLAVVRRGRSGALSRTLLGPATPSRQDFCCPTVSCVSTSPRSRPSSSRRRRRRRRHQRGGLILNHRN